MVKPPASDVDGLLLWDSFPEEAMGKSTDVSTDYMVSVQGKVSSLFLSRIFMTSPLLCLVFRRHLGPTQEIDILPKGKTRGTRCTGLELLMTTHTLVC